MPSFISTATCSTSHPSSANHDSLILGPMQLLLPIVPVCNLVNTGLLNMRSLNTKSFFANYHGLSVLSAVNLETQDIWVSHKTVS